MPRAPNLGRPSMTSRRYKVIYVLPLQPGVALGAPRVSWSLSFSARLD